MKNPIGCPNLSVFPVSSPEFLKNGAGVHDFHLNEGEEGNIFEFPFVLDLNVRVVVEELPPSSRNIKSIG